MSITDANGNVTSYSYDENNRLLQEIYADGTAQSFTYDAIGNLITRTDQKGQMTTYIYDNQNRRIKVDYPVINDNEYTYDSVGNLLTANNQNTTISFAYNNAYRLIQSIQNGESVSYSYDMSNNLKTITYPSGKIFKEKMNLRDLLIQVEDAISQQIVQYAYDDANNLQTKSYLNNITANYTYNANGWITALNYNDGGAQIIGFQYGFDKEGNKLYSYKSHDLSNSEQYIYDAKSRLVQFRRGVLDTNGNIASPVAQTTYNMVLY